MMNHNTSQQVVPRLIVFVVVLDLLIYIYIYIFLNKIGMGKFVLCYKIKEK